MMGWERTALMQREKDVTDGWERIPRMQRDKDVTDGEEKGCQ